MASVIFNTPKSSINKYADKRESQESFYSPEYIFPYLGSYKLILLLRKNTEAALKRCINGIICLN
ncbi:hypothetical protein NG798_12050 [Ancylothrix sp. C2]|nr:hypothetical protein [Ancylothrix sp. D3o]